MKSWGTLYSMAEGNFGLVTYAEAKRIGVGIREIDRWIDAGRLERVARGVYRVSSIAPSGLDVFAVAVETIGPEAYLYGESVIAMLHLAPTNPTWLYVASPKRIRKAVSANLKVVRGDVGYEFANYDGIRSQRLEDAIRACRGYMRPDRRIAAVREGVLQGYLTQSLGNKLIREIRYDSAS